MQPHFLKLETAKCKIENDGSSTPLGQGESFPLFFQLLSIYAAELRGPVGVLGEERCLILVG